MSTTTVSPGRAGSADRVREASRLVWPNLPVLLLGSVPVAAGWAVARALPPSLGWLALLGIGLGVVPAFAALLRGCEVLLGGDHFGIADLVRALGRAYRPAVRVSLLPTAALLLALLAAELWRVTGQGWMLASLGAAAAVGLVGLVAGVVTLPYVLRTRCGWREGWLVGLYLTTRAPVPVLAVLAAAGLVVWGAAHLSFALLLLLPAPLALVWAAAVAVVTDEGRSRLVLRRSAG